MCLHAPHKYCCHSGAVRMLQVYMPSFGCLCVKRIATDSRMGIMLSTVATWESTIDPGQISEGENAEVVPNVGGD